MANASAGTEWLQKKYVQSIYATYDTDLIFTANIDAKSRAKRFFFYRLWWMNRLKHVKQDSRITQFERNHCKVLYWTSRFFSIDITNTKSWRLIHYVFCRDGSDFPCVLRMRACAWVCVGLVCACVSDRWVLCKVHYLRMRYLRSCFAILLGFYVGSDKYYEYDTLLFLNGNTSLAVFS